MASLEESLEQLKYQTTALKVSIHCEGCKRKVKKVLHSIEGVYHTTIDIQQQKVIVVGNVDPNNLVRKLNKTGKHAELWPEPFNQNPPGGSGGGGGKKSKNKKKNNNNNNPSEPQKPNENSEQHQGSSSDEESPEDHSGKPDQDREQEKEKPEGNVVTVIQHPSFTPHGPHPMQHPSFTPHGPHPPPQMIQVGGGPPSAAGGGGGGGGSGSSGGKKKKKKKKKNNNPNSNINNNGNNMNNGGNSGGSGEITESNTHQMPVNAIVSQGFIGGAGGHMDAIGYPSGAASHIPSYVVSYSAVQPSASFGGSYLHPYELAPPAGSAYNGGCFYPPAVVTTVPAGGGSYYMFSEENANACVVM